MQSVRLGTGMSFDRSFACKRPALLTQARLRAQDSRLYANRTVPTKALVPQAALIPYAGRSKELFEARCPKAIKSKNENFQLRTGAAARPVLELRRRSISQIITAGPTTHIPAMMDIADALSAIT